MGKARPRRRTVKLPDFSEMFAATFGDCPGGIRFRLRDVSNLPHDLAFLNGLIHDASFSLASVTESRNRVTIRCQRDTWEDLRATNQLDQRDAKLSFHPARIERVSFNGLAEATEDKDKRRCLVNIHTAMRGIPEDTEMPRVFVLNCTDCSIEIATPEFGYVVEVRDEC